LLSWWFSEEPFSCMYLWKSKIIETFLRLWMVRLIFLTKVESLTEQDEIEVETLLRISSNISLLIYTITSI